MTYQDKKMQILNKLAEGERNWIDDELVGTTLYDEKLAEVDKAVLEASQAIDELVKEYVIGKSDENIVTVDEANALYDKTQNHLVYDIRRNANRNGDIRNGLRDEQRQVIDKEKSKMTTYICGGCGHEAKNCKCVITENW